MSKKIKLKINVLDEQHWKFQDYKQRITAKDWKELLLNDDDHINFNGRVTKLVAKNLGYGVIEISKQLPHNERKNDERV